MRGLDDCHGMSGPTNYDVSILKTVWVIRMELDSVNIEAERAISSRDVTSLAI